ncbi:MAG TPA: cysteine desulfurase, partial [Herminiimonas sp.]|nr:cysteine desulfurase [Herminiimonas sp.]
MSTLPSNPVNVPQAPEAPFDPALLARMASAMFAALPTEVAGPVGARNFSGLPPASIPGVGQASPLAGVQAPVNIAPPGSPLASPAGFGPAMPGTPIPQGQVPGANLIPASPMQLPSLANRAPSLLPHATAPNGVPDTVISTLPAYEPRLGGAVLGVPEAHAASPSQASAHPAAPDASASSYYFLQHGHPSASGHDPSSKPA